MSDEKPKSVLEIQVGKYRLSVSYNGQLWLYGPDDDGFQLNLAQMRYLEKMLGAFFKEHM